MLPPCLPPFPPSPPSPSPSHTSPLQVSPSLTESPKNRLHTIPVTISNKAEQGEGRDAPWHLNQWLSYNNSMIFNLSLLPPSLQTPRQHSGGVSREEKKNQLSISVLVFQARWQKWRLNVKTAKCGNAACVEIQMGRSSCGCQLFVNAPSRDLYLQTVCLTVWGKEKAQMCLNSQGLWMHVLSLCLREATDGGVLPPWAGTTVAAATPSCSEDKIYSWNITTAWFMPSFQSH